MTWSVENAAVNDSSASAVVTGTTVEPYRLSADTDASNQLIRQSSVDIKTFIIKQVIKPVFVALDAAAINGQGATQNQPLGLVNTGVNPQGQSAYDQLAYSGVTFGGTPTWQKVSNLLTAVEGQNVDTQAIKFLTSPTSKNVMLNTPIISGYPKFLWCPMTETVAGRTGLVSNNVSSNQLITGDFSEMAVFVWALFVETNPFVLASQFMTRFTVNLLANVLPIYGTAFAASTDAV